MNGLYYISSSGSRFPAAFSIAFKSSGSEFSSGGREVVALSAEEEPGDTFSPQSLLPTHFLMPFGLGCQFGFFLRLLLGGFLFFFLSHVAADT